MRSYILSIYTYDNSEYSVDWNYKDFCSVLSDKDTKFVKFIDVSNHEHCINISNIKSVHKRSILVQRTKIDWITRHFLSRPWLWLEEEIYEKSILSLEK